MWPRRSSQFRSLPRRLVTIVTAMFRSVRVDVRVRESDQVLRRALSEYRLVVESESGHSFRRRIDRGQRGCGQLPTDGRATHEIRGPRRTKGACCRTDPVGIVIASRLDLHILYPSNQARLGARRISRVLSRTSPRDHSLRARLRSHLWLLRILQSNLGGSTTESARSVDLPFVSLCHFCVGRFGEASLQRRRCGTAGQAGGLSVRYSEEASRSGQLRRSACEVRTGTSNSDVSSSKEISPSRLAAIPVCSIASRKSSDRKASLDCTKACRRV